jgi:prevent-host-death family protein
LYSVSIKEARENFSEIVERAAIGGESFVVTKFGKSKAIIAPFTGVRKSNDRNRKRALEDTKGAWSGRKDIKDAAEWVAELRAK